MNRRGWERKIAGNLLLARKARERFRVPQVSVVPYRGKAGVQKDQVHENGASVLFGSPIDIDEWNQRFQQDAAMVETWGGGLLR